MASASNKNGVSIENWLLGAADMLRGAEDASKYKDYILPLVFAKRLCDVFDDELNRIAEEVGSRENAFNLVNADRKLVRYYLPLLPEDRDQPVWSVIRNLSSGIGEELTTLLHDIARENPSLEGIIDRVDFSATTRGQRDIDDDRLSNLIEALSTKRLGLKDVDPDIIGRSYEYLIRKFAEKSGQSAGEFYTPPEVGEIMARVMDGEPGRFPEGAGFPGKASADWGWVQHMHASLESEGKAAVVLDTGAASRGSGSANANKEKRIRRWYVENDLIEAVLYLPENLFYNTPAPGIGLFLNNQKPESRRGRILLVNASQAFEKGDPKNYIPSNQVDRIAETLLTWTEEEKFSRVVDHETVRENDYNISPSRYIHTADAQTYRPISEIVADLRTIEKEAAEADAKLNEILKKIGVDA